jgi:hypothetical protein
MKYIIYLHPDGNNPGKKQLDNMWLEMEHLHNAGLISCNDAMFYPPHCTLTSFTDNSDDLIPVLRNLSGRLSVDKLSMFGRDDLICINLRSAIINRILSEISGLIDTPSVGKLHISLAHNFSDSDYSMILDVIERNIRLNEWTNDYCAILWEVNDSDPDNRWRPIASTR